MEQRVSLKGHEYELAKVLAKCPILGQKWKELAYALKVQEDMERYEKDESCKLRLLHVLTQYISKNGAQATFEKLIAILEEEEFMTAADSVQVYLETQVIVTLESPPKKPNIRLNSSSKSISSPNLTNLDLPEICFEHRFECKSCEWIFIVQRPSPQNGRAAISLSTDSSS